MFGLLLSLFLVVLITYFIWRSKEDLF